MTRFLSILVLGLLVLPARGEELALNGSSPDQWRAALAEMEQGHSSQAIPAFIDIDKLERAPAPTPAAHLARYFILLNLASMERFDDMAKRMPLLRRELLPAPFQDDALRIEAQALIETDRFAAALELLPDSIRSGRLLLLRGRALAGMQGNGVPAIDALSAGLIAADDAPRQEKQAAVSALLLLLGEEGRLAEAAQLEGLLAELGLGP